MRHYSKDENKEQKLVDICFELCLMMNTNKTYFNNKTNTEVAEWVADQLTKCGFPTTPIGSSWGVLNRE